MESVQSVIIYLLVRRHLPYLTVLLALALVTLFARLGSLPLSGSDEPRYARIAQEMRDAGEWVTPTLQGKPWLEKPPLYYWMTIPFLRLFDKPETAARFAPAACALACAAAIYVLGSSLWTPLAGWMGASILLTSLGFAGYGRSASTDMPFTCCLTIALAILTAAACKNIGFKKVFWAYVFLGLATLAKGPVALVLAGGIMLLVWYLDESGFALSRWHVISGFMIALAVSAPWFWLVFRENGYAFILTFFVNHNLARYVTGIHHHTQPFYYYFGALIVLLFPWSGWLPALISGSPIKGLRKWREWDLGMVFLACWALFPIFFFSLSDSKLAGYILPSLPPLALILGVRLSRWFEGNIAARGFRASMWLQMALSAGLAVAAPHFFDKDYGGNWQVGAILSAVALIPSLLVFAFGIMGSCARAFGAAVLQGVLLIAATVSFAFPVLADYHSARDIALQGLQERREGEPIVTYAYFHHSLHYYTGYQVYGKLDSPEELRDFGRRHPTFLVVTDGRRLPEVLALEGYSASILGKHGNTILLRLSR